MSVFAVDYRYDHRADERTALRPAHRAHLAELLEAGQLLASGPIDDGAGALLLIVASDADAALAVLEADPFLQAGLIASREARAWAPVIGPWAHLA